MRAIDTYTFLSQTQEGVLLRIGQREGFQGSEDDGILRIVSQVEKWKFLTSKPYDMQ
jgi:hypothetical protein